MGATDAQLRAVLDAAVHLLGARQDGMLTVEEWVTLASAVAACKGRKASHLLSARDLADASDLGLAIDGR